MSCSVSVLGDSGQMVRCRSYSKLLGMTLKLVKKEKHRGKSKFLLHYHCFFFCHCYSHRSSFPPHDNAIKIV